MIKRQILPGAQTDIGDEGAALLLDGFLELITDDIVIHQTAVVIHQIVLHREVEA